VLGVIVTFLWASSVVLLRLGLSEEVTDPIGFAGVRFTLAAILLFPLALPRLRSAGVARIGPRALFGAFFYGWLMFGIAQIAVHVALGTVSASTMGLMIGLTPVVTAVFVVRGGRERASLLQLGGIGVLVVGVLIFFGLEVPEPDLLPMVLLAAVVPLVVGVATVLGRRLAIRVERYGGSLGLTAMAMIAGGLFTLVFGLVVEGVPQFTVRAWLLILWMAGVNTAMAYTLWTQVQRTLRAVESSVLGDVTVLQTALLGWLVLGEALGAFEIVGLVLAVIGVVIVQVAPTLRARRLR
jgi:drug/metabolite transporter (DMT)-like permease